MPTRAAEPRRDDAGRLETELLQHPSGSGIVQEVRALQAPQVERAGDLD